MKKPTNVDNKAVGAANGSNASAMAELGEHSKAWMKKLASVDKKSMDAANGSNASAMASVVVLVRFGSRSLWFTCSSKFVSVHVFTYVFVDVRFRSLPFMCSSTFVHVHVFVHVRARSRVR